MAKAKTGSKHGRRASARPRRIPMRARGPRPGLRPIERPVPASAPEMEEFEEGRYPESFRAHPGYEEDEEVRSEAPAGPIEARRRRRAEDILRRGAPERGPVS